jgi:RNA polymerase sigma-70 factor (ECF subfamily)
MPSTDPACDDEALYTRFVQGDDSACVALFKRHNQRLYTYCLKMTGDPDQAEDLAQDVWGRLIELRSNGRPLQNPVGFLIRMARNLCLDHLKARRKVQSLEVLSESLHPAYSMPEVSDREELVVRSIEKLPVDYQDVLILNTYCGYSFEEIAAMLGKSPEAIWTRASRARTLLRSIVRAASGSRPSRSKRNSKIGGREK